MKKSFKHTARGSGIFTFRSWTNKSYSAFLSLGRQIRIGHLKVVVSALLSTKSSVLRKRPIVFLEELMRSLTSPEGDCSIESREISGLLLLQAEITIFPPSPGHGRGYAGSIYILLNHLAAKILAVFLLIICVGQGSLTAQSDTTIMLEEIAISGNRLVIPFAEASRSIYVIDRKQIQFSPVQSIPEILIYVPGVDIRQRGPMGVQADIAIRGGTFEQTLVLVNGIKLTDPQTGHHMMSLPFNMENIDRIEVLKGPGARIYGQNAFAGAVNFITRVPDERKLTVRGYGGSFGSYGGTLAIGLPSGKYSQFISVGGDASNGYRYNTDYKTGDFFYQSEMKLWNGKLVIMSGWTGRKFGANGFYASPDYHDQYEKVQTGVTGISFEQESNSIRYKSRIYWRGNRDRYIFIRESPDTYENFHKTNVLGAEWNASIEWGAGVAGVGLEYRKELIRGDWVRGGVESKSNLDGFSRDQAGLYLEHRIKIGTILDLTPGLYLNWYSDFGWNIFPGVDLGYSINEKWRIYANAGKSYRVPTFYDQYYKSPVELGNKNLKPEQAWTYEVGLQFENSGLFAGANIFYRRSEGLIDWIYSEADSIWKAQNIREGKALGVELAVAVDFKVLTKRKLFLERLRFSYNYIDNRLYGIKALQSRYALDNIRNQLIAGLDHRIFRKLKNSLKFRFIDRIDQNPYLLMDDRLYWEQNERVMIFLEATNLTNQSYTEVMTPMPGRWIRAGIRWEIDF